MKIKILFITLRLDYVKNILNQHLLSLFLYLLNVVKKALSREYRNGQDDIAM